MLFGKNYFTVKMTGKKVKIDTDKTEFTVSVKDGKATFDVEAEPEVIELENLDCSDFCDCCKECIEEPIPEVVVEDNKSKTTKKKTLDTVC